jgi:RNA polymerase subunit RPABC4/transcription elongation factor Spt4
MKTFICPRCSEVLTALDGEDFLVCPRCGNTLFVSNFIGDISIITENETYDRKNEDTDGASE